jgi:hypothetical protein
MGASLGRRLLVHAFTLFISLVGLTHAATTWENSSFSGSVCGEGSLGVIVEVLPSLQASKGGFGKPPSLVATQRALFLAQVYGLLPQINRQRAREFVTHALASLVADDEPPSAGTDSSAQNKTRTGSVEHDKDKVKAAGTRIMFRSVDDLHAAILCSQVLGLEQHLPDVSEIITFLLSLWDEGTGLFAKTPGGGGDIRSSALAMSVAEQQGKRHQLSQHAARIRAVLQNCSHTREQTAKKCNATKLALFDVPRNISRGLPPVSINYFALLVAHLTDFHISPERSAAMAADIASLQNLDRHTAKYGGVFDDCTRSVVSIESLNRAL